jgi:phosphoribosylanthranilate isomerase
MLQIQQVINNSKNKPLIKVCGMTLLHQVNELIDIGVDFCGFIFYEKSKRFVTPHLSNAQIANISPAIKKVGVFVNASEADVLNIAYECKLDAIQLHGDESAYYCKKIAQHFFTIKAIGINNEVDVNQLLATYEQNVHAFLFDTKHETYGGTGKKFNWGVLEKIKINIPFILSGGISPLDVADLKLFCTSSTAKNLIALDINSKFENNYGDKHINSIKNFVIDMNSSQ